MCGAEPPPGISLNFDIAAQAPKATICFILASSTPPNPLHDRRVEGMTWVPFLCVVGGSLAALWPWPLIVWVFEFVGGLVAPGP